MTGVSIDTSNAPAGFSWPGALGTFTPTIVETPGSGSGEVDWTFTIDNALVQGLSAFQNVQQIYTVQISDGHGGKVSPGGHGIDLRRRRRAGSGQRRGERGVYGPGCSGDAGAQSDSQ